MAAGVDVRARPAPRRPRRMGQHRHAQRRRRAARPPRRDARARGRAVRPAPGARAAAGESGSTCTRRSRAGVERGRSALPPRHRLPARHGRGAGRFRVDGHHVYGPGVADMKGGVAVAIHAARLLANGAASLRASSRSSRPPTRRPGPPRSEQIDRATRAASTPSCAWSAGASTARSSPHGRAAAGSGSTPRAGRRTRESSPTRVATPCFALCHEAIRLVEAPPRTRRPHLPGHRARRRARREHRAGRGISHRRPARPDDGGSRLGHGPGARLRQLPGHRAFARRISAARPRSSARRRSPRSLRLRSHSVSTLGHRFGETSTGGVSDGSWTAWSGIPTLDGLGPVGGRGPHAGRVRRAAVVRAPARCRRRPRRSRGRRAPRLEAAPGSSRSDH